MTLIAFCKDCNAPLGTGHFAGCPERVVEYEPSMAEVSAAMVALFSGPYPFGGEAFTRVVASLKAAYAVRQKEGAVTYGSKNPAGL